VGASPPVGPPDYGLTALAEQCPRGRYSHICLLKGCERLFQPSHPLRRYCSKACQDAARQWRRWRAAQQYRATERGQQQRREQSRRYRERRRQRQAAAAAGAPEAVANEREGPREAEFSEDFAGTPCRRPGCYELFAAPAHEPPQCFCCAECRRALRRVLDRETRWRRRRRQRLTNRYRPVRRC
jgi:hypothetical protein